MFKKELHLKKKHWDEITVEQLERKMNEEKFDKEFIEEILKIFKERIEKHGKEAFGKWIYNLHFRVPEEFQNEQISISVYEKYHKWLEGEVIKLENETKMSWEIQTEDLQDLDNKARKAQLVIRHRLSEIVLDLLE
ncbi:hypothetical protein QWY16_09190 [Planococcus shenhongbingii]|uniref:Uncharacterized protein n=1 Tax=Planococcus shenhongbingii TaxID=3058398 RepID=A0ABT8ND64_9BACL|nr:MULTISPECIES: hypothetical protein [unclassified Planococcus (in: firmicutes)]MDN7245629.1 hypothetical protein [Planococcus sp. N017]WKA60260.1 hypothetical protein QWY16_09190 [Planococcus sp. N016]